MSDGGADGPRELVHDYADAVSRQDPDGVAALFTADGVWHVGGYGEPRGRTEIADFLAGLLEQWEVIVHALASGNVHVDPADPRRATGRWYITEFGRRTDGTDVLYAGVYDDEYVRGPDRWRFARRTYTSLYRKPT
jgi:ketosteroid isomerase-like protein